MISIIFDRTAEMWSVHVITTITYAIQYNELIYFGNPLCFNETDKCLFLRVKFKQKRFLAVKILQLKKKKSSA